MNTDIPDKSTSQGQTSTALYNLEMNYSIEQRINIFLCVITENKIDIE